MTDSKFDVGRFVGGKIRHLLSGSSPSSRALLAQLRQAAAAEPGTVPSVWSVTAEGLPDDMGEELRLRTETAVHVALTQYATHQQARAASMHQPTQRFGTAVRRLADKQAGPDQDPHETPVFARFSAMLNATTLAGLLAHSRGIITQLRGEDLGFDYAAYSRDIYFFLTPGFAGDVRRRWGQDFHRRHTINTTSDTSEGASQ